MSSFIRECVKYNEKAGIYYENDIVYKCMSNNIQKRNTCVLNFS